MAETDNPLFFNVEENCVALKINREIYLRILAKAVEQTERDILELEAALPVENFEKVQAIAHRLKGDYGNMRVEALSTVARDLNNVAKTTKDKEQSSHLLKTFKDTFQKLQKALAGPSQENKI